MQVPKCLTIPEETCRDTPTQACHPVPFLKPVKYDDDVDGDDEDDGDVDDDDVDDNDNDTLIPRKLAKECQYCAAYEDVLIDYKFEKNCERHEKPNCYTAYKEVTITYI